MLKTNEDNIKIKQNEIDYIKKSIDEFIKIKMQEEKTLIKDIEKIKKEEPNIIELLYQNQNQNEIDRKKATLNEYSAMVESWKQSGGKRLKKYYIRNKYLI